MCGYWDALHPNTHIYKHLLTTGKDLLKVEDNDLLLLIAKADNQLATAILRLPTRRLGYLLLRQGAVAQAAALFKESLRSILKPMIEQAVLRRWSDWPPSTHLMQRLRWRHRYWARFRHSSPLSSSHYPS